MLEEGKIHVLVTFAEDFALDERKSAPVTIYFSSADEKSRTAAQAVREVLRRWNGELRLARLQDLGKPIDFINPITLQDRDVATPAEAGAAKLSSMFAFLLVIMSLTGAFCPAVDLCAGEKERGTLETLLSSPAERSEIVLGKLLTIMIFSMATAVLNLVTMGMTGWLLMSRLPHIGPPPSMAVVWLAIALVPVSALFSALCLALAAFARSTKEGQYYLIPLLLVTTPLVLLPMAPGVELNVGNSLIPITGVVLLLRSMLEGNFLQDWKFRFGSTRFCVRSYPPRRVDVPLFNWKREPRWRPLLSSLRSSAGWSWE